MEENIRKFDHRIRGLEPHVISFLTSIDEMRGIFRVGIRMVPETFISLRRSVLVTSAGASTRIEGSRLSDEEVEKIMHDLSYSRFADRDSQEVQGYLEVLQNVFDGFQGLQLRESVIQSLHKELLKYSSKDDLHRGGYKQKENIVGILGKSGKVAEIVFETTPAWQMPKEMTELVDWTREALEKERFHPLLVIANFIVEFLKIHPFEDGNGRLSRVLTNLLLLRSGYLFAQYVSHEQIVERRKDEYYLALRTSQKTFGTADDTIAPWLNFFLGVVKEQAARSLEIVNGETNDDVLSPKQSIVWKHLMGVAEASPGDIARATGILIPTVRKALERLVEMGKIKRVGRGRGTRYVRL